METPVCVVGDRLQVGQIPTSFTTFSKLFPGLSTINGPLCVGFIGGDVPIANAMFASGYTPQTAVSLASVGITNIFGQFNVLALSNFTGITNNFGATFKYALSLKNGVDIKNAINLGNAPTIFNGPLTVHASITTKLIDSGKCKSNEGSFGSIFANIGSFGSISAKVKTFKIPHPSKSKHTLVHACLEGPENGVYYRGHLSNSNIINLPDYWENLIDIKTITVQLMPYTYHQELYIKSIESGKYIHIVNNNGSPIECDYLVFAERKDIEKLKVEVKN